MSKQNIIVIALIIIVCYFVFYKKTTIITDHMENFSGHRDDDFNVINFSDDNNEN